MQNLSVVEPYPTMAATYSEQHAAENADIGSALTAAPVTNGDLAVRPPPTNTADAQLAAIASLEAQPTSPLSKMLLEALKADKVTQEYDRLVEDDLRFHKTALDRERSAGSAVPVALVDAGRDPRRRRSSVAAGTPMDVDGALSTQFTALPGSIPAPFVDKSRDPRIR